jgi:hypothetical protein
MSLLRPLSLLLIPFLGGCVAFDSQPPPVSHSSGFFAEFDRMVDKTMAQSTADGKAATFVSEFNWRVNEGPSDIEVHAVGSTWDKVSAFMDIGLLSADVMASVNDSAHPRVDIFADAADRVLRSDYLAITSWNQSVDTKEQLRPTADIVWESLYLVLTESGHAQRKVSSTKGYWVDGHWTRTAGSQHNLWVNGYNQTIWHAETCHDEYVGTECASVWISESCTDVWIDDGYWESTCTQYDDDDNCVEWTDVWVDTGYYETQCIDGHYEDQCTDVYQTVCNPEYWEDIYIPAHAVEGVLIPGELTWVEGHEAEATTERIEVLPEQEAAILGLGIEYVLSFGPDYVQGSCRTELEAAQQAFTVEAPEDSIKVSRKSILYCLSRH